MNNFSVIGILLLAFLVGFKADASAQQVKASEEEEVIDLDSLKEEEGAQHDGGSNPEETLLPVEAKTVENERHRALMLGALVLLIPVVSLLLPIRRDS